MRNLKRALSLLLAVVMVIGMMVVGASAASYTDFSDKGEIVNKDAVSMLTTLGIIEGKPDGSYAPGEGVDRAQMAKMISVIMNQGADNSALYVNSPTGLTDIATNWAKGHINYCYTLGIIAGRGNGTFDPSAGVTGVEAAKMLLVAAGYDPKIEGFEGSDWAINVNAKASALGIFRNFTKDVTAPLNRDDAALLIYNALDIEMIEKYENGYALAFKDSRTILSAMYGVYKVEGVVVANEWAQLQKTDSDAALREGKTTLDNVIVYDSTTANTTIDEGVREKDPVTFSVSTPVEYMGKTVTLYIEKTTILSNSKVLGVATKDDVNVINTTAATEDTAKDYLKGTGVSVGDNTEYYVNYGYCKSDAEARSLINEHANYDLDQDNDKFALNGIEVEVIDNNDDGTAEYVLYTMETLSEVKSYSERNEKLALYDYKRDNRDRLNGEAESFNVDFEDVVFGENVTVDTNDLVLYVQYGGRTYITLPEIISGKMTRVDRDKNDELYITVNDTEYRQSYIPDAASLVDPELTHFDITNANKEPGFDDEYDFILDSNGYVVTIRPAEEKVTNYALVLESAWTQNALTKSGEVTVLMADGSKGTYKINWDASKKNAFGDKAEDMQNYLGTKDVNNTAGKEDTLGSAVGTVISYSLNADKVLTIESVLGTHKIATDGTVDDGNSGKGSKDEHFCDGSAPYAYIDYNKNAETAGVSGLTTGDTPNLQWTLRQDYDGGDASIKLTDVKYGASVEYAIDRNTVAFYYYDKDHDGVAEDGEYGVAKGWDNMGDVDAVYGKDARTEDQGNNVAVQVYPVEKKNSDKRWEATKLAEVVLFNAESTVSSQDYMLVLNRNAYTASDELWLNVVLEDGTAKEVKIDSKGGYDFDTTSSYMKAYAYAENADGTYDIVKGSAINEHDAELLLRGTVDSNRIFALPDSAKVWDVTDTKSAKDDVQSSTFTYQTVNAVIIPTTVGGDTIRTAFIWELDEDDNTPGQGEKFNAYVDEDRDGNLNLYWYKNEPGASQVRQLMETYLREDVRSARYDRDHKDWTVTTERGDVYYVNSVEMKLVSFNGTNLYAVKGTNKQVDGDALTFTVSQTVADALKNGDAIVTTLDTAIGTDGSVISISGREVTYTGKLTDATGDVALKLAYKVTLNDGVTAKISTGAPVDTYVAVGEKLTLSAGNTNGYAIHANGTATGTVADGVKNAEAVYTMPSGTVSFTFAPASGNVGDLQLNTLTINGQKVSLNETNKTGSVTLPYSVYNGQNFSAVSNPSTGISYFDKNDKSITNNSTAYNAAGYDFSTITVVVTSGSKSVNYTIKVTMEEPNTSAAVEKVFVKGVEADKDSAANTYNVTVPYNASRDITIPQVAVETAGSVSSVSVASNSLNIAAGEVKESNTDIITYAAGTRSFTFTVTPESGSAVTYTVNVTIDSADRVGLKLIAGANATVDPSSFPKAIPSDTPFTFKVTPATGYSAAVTYTIDGGKAVTLTANSESEYELSTDILAEAAGKELTVNVTATKLPTVTVGYATTERLVVNGKLLDKGESITVEKGSKIVVTVSTGKVLQVASGTPGTEYGECKNDPIGSNTWVITNIMGDITIRSIAQ